MCTGLGAQESPPLQPRPIAESAERIARELWPIDLHGQLDGMYEIFERIPATKRMVILRRADHMHFMDNVEQLHEAVRTSPPWIPELDYLQKEMRPIAELCTAEQSHVFVRGLTVAHFDAVLKQDDEARRFLAGDIQAELAPRGVDAFVHPAQARAVSR